MTRIFYEELVSIVVGKNKCKKDMVIKNISQWSTIFEETLTYWLLENNKEKWIHDIDGKDILSDPPRNIVVAESSSTDESSIQGIPLTNIYKSKYTSSRQGNTKYKSWSQKGIKRFNEILKSIHVQRKSREGKLYEDKFLDYMIEKHGDKRISQASITPPTEEEITIITGIGTDLNDAISLMGTEEDSQIASNDGEEQLIADDTSHQSCNIHSQFPDSLHFSRENSMPPLRREELTKQVSDSDSNVSDNNFNNEDDVQTLVDAEKRMQKTVENSIVASKKYNELAVRYEKAIEAAKKPSKGKKKHTAAITLKRTLTQLENAKQAALDAEVAQKNAKEQLFHLQEKIAKKANMIKRILRV